MQVIEELSQHCAELQRIQDGFSRCVNVCVCVHVCVRCCELL